MCPVKSESVVLAQMFNVSFYCQLDFVYRSHDQTAASWLAKRPANPNHQIFWPIRSNHLPPMRSRMPLTCIKQNTDRWLTCLWSDGDCREELWGAGPLKTITSPCSWVWKVRWVWLWLLFMFSGLSRRKEKGKQKEAGNKKYNYNHLVWLVRLVAVVLFKQNS